MTGNWQPWLGTVRLGGAADREHEMRVAIWSKDQDTYDGILQQAADRQGWQVLEVVDVGPAFLWLTHNPDDAEALGLVWSIAADRPIAFGVARASQSESFLKAPERLEVSPLDGQFGVHPRQSVPDAAQDMLFGQPPPSTVEAQHYGTHHPPMRLFAVMDAAKLPLLPQLLEVSGLRWRSLFTGAAEEALSDVAPYLVELQEGNDFTRRMFTRSGRSSDLWDLEAGIFLRTRAEFDALWKHLRRFTRMRDEAGEWYYFRFWETSSARAYFPTLAARPGAAAAWFGLNIVPALYAVLIPSARDDSILQIIALPQDQLAPNIRVPVPVLTQDDLRLLGSSRMADDVRHLSDLLAKTFPEALEGVGEQQRHQMTGAVVQRMMGYGFRQLDLLFILLTWELFYGPRFERRDTEGRLLSILNGPQDEAERFDALKSRMAELL